MKKVISILLAVIFLFSFAACGGETDPEETSAPSGTQIASPADRHDINIVALKGPTGMGMAGLMNVPDEESNYNISLAAAPTEIAGFIADGSTDIAACPLNLAAALCKKTNGAVQLLAINTLGVLYILENGNTVTDMASLKGKTIYACGQGATPEYALNYLLEKAGLDKEKDVEIVWKSEHSEVATLLAAGEAQIALLPEPNVTAVMAQNENVRIAVDMTKEWKNNAEGEFAMGCLIVTKIFAHNHPETVAQFLKDYSDSVSAVNANTDEICNVIAEQGIVGSAAIAKKAIPNCNMVCMTGKEMKAVAQSNFKVLFDADPASIGGEMPDDSFYYIAQ